MVGASTQISFANLSEPGLPRIRCARPQKGEPVGNRTGTRTGTIARSSAVTLGSQALRVPTGGTVPTYAYACTACEHRFDVVQAFSEDSLTDCPECQGRLRKLFSAIGVVFKGSGFYRNDSRNDSRRGPDKSTRTGSDKDSRRGADSAIVSSTPAESGSSSNGSSSTSSDGSTSAAAPESGSSGTTKTATKSAAKSGAKSEGSAA